MSLVIEFWRFLRIRKKLWLLPIIVILVLFGGLLILAQQKQLWREGSGSETSQDGGAGAC